VSEPAVASPTSPQEIALLEELDTLRQSYGRLESTALSLRGNLQQVQAELARANLARSELEERLQSQTSKDEDLESLRRNLIEAQAAREEAEEAAEIWRRQAERATTSETEEEERRDTLQAELEKAQAAVVRSGEELTRRDAEIAGRDRELARLGQEVARLGQEIGSRDQKIARLEQGISGKDQEVTRRSEEVNSRDMVISRQGQVLESKDQEITRLGEEIAGQDQEIARLGEGIAELRSQAQAQAQAQTQALEEQLAKLELELRQRDAQAQEAQRTLASKEQQILELQEAIQVERREARRAEAAAPLLEVVEPLPTARDEEKDLPSAEAAVEQVLAWAEAWSRQDVEAYLASYSQRFKPQDGSDRSLWVAQRRQRVVAPRSIQVTLREMQASLLGEDRARLLFEQTYQSDTFRDVVRKTLVLVREAGAWKILEERVEGTGT